MTGAQVAEYLNVSTPFYYGLENGSKTLNQEYLEKLSTLFGISIDELLGRYETPPGVIDDFPKDVKIMMRDAADLTPEQRKMIHNLIKEIKDSKKK